MKLRALAAWLLLALPLLAHHSFVAEFDETKPIKVSGLVTKVEWQNPHVWFYVDVKDDSGKVTNWGFRRRRPPASSCAAASPNPSSSPA